MSRSRRATPGDRRGLRQGVRRALSAALAACVVGGLVVAGAVAAVPTVPVTVRSATTPPVTDYTSGPYGDRLCPTSPTAGLSCGLGRSVLTTVQGVGHRDRAVAAGAVCERQDGLWVCFDVRSLLVQRGGTTYGDTFLSPDGPRTLGADLVAHESEHVRQWRLFGPDFSIMYLAEGVDPCDNYFEQQAGLAAGGYSCG